MILDRNCTEIVCNAIREDELQETTDNSLSFKFSEGAVDILYSTTEVMMYEVQHTDSKKVSTVSTSE